MPRKIAILGGGMSGLAAAYELSKTNAYDITVYQMGWRLGGKAASGRDAEGRNLEHGLHMWFGCYHNVFALTRDVYAAWQMPAGCPLRGIDDVAKKQSFTPIGVQRADGTWTHFPVRWPENQAIPGTGGLDMSPGDAFVAMLDLFRIVAQSVAAELNLDPPQFDALSPGFTTFLDWAADGAADLELLAVTEAQKAERIVFFMESAYTLYKALSGFPELVFTWSDHPLGTRLRVLRELFDVLVAATRGYYRDLAVPNRPYEAIDDMEFRAWLVSHGADPAIVAESSVVHMLYDTMFQYIDGDVDRPSYAAGSALGVLARLVGTFKGAVMYDIQAGMGEAVVAPLYEVLKARGVKFEFFHKVQRLLLSADKRSVERIVFDRQARVRTPPYDPLDTLATPSGPLRVWPAQPRWADLDPTATPTPDFESHWCQEPAVEQPVKHRGADFDDVVLAIAMGGYKPLNGTDRSLCEELIANDARFADFVQRQYLVPSQGVQLWSDRTLAQLGWTAGHAAMVAGPQYLNIWADMSQVLPFEPWPNPRPQTLHYLTGTFKTQLHKAPSTNAAVPSLARAQLRAYTIDWLNRKSYVIFPLACNGVVFDYDALRAAAGTFGAARLDAQYIRANIDPTECCVSSAAGTTKYRLGPTVAAYDNLYLAGEATRHGFNTTTIEGAVMSGIAAARAIANDPTPIVGYDFLTTPL